MFRNTGKHTDTGSCFEKFGYVKTTRVTLNNYITEDHQGI